MNLSNAGRRADWQSVLACAGICIVVIAIFLITDPFVGIGVNDDWAYARMAKEFAETGALRYDGSSYSAVGVHAFWGMLAVKLFGFSFPVLRASMMPISAGCGIALFLICRRIGLPVFGSMLGAFSFVLSPLFIPVGTSYMTDPTAILLLLLSAYCILRSLDDPKATAWLVAGMAAGLLAGTVRQVFWGAPLLMAVGFVFLHRSNRRLARNGVIALVGTAVVILVCIHWLHSQAFVVKETIPVPHKLYMVRKIMKQGVLLLLSTGLFCAPALFDLVGNRENWRRPALPLLAIAVGTPLLLFRFPWVFSAPWVANLVTKFGVLPANAVLPGDGVAVLPDPVWRFAGFLTVTLLLAVMAMSGNVYRCARSGADGSPVLTERLSAYVVLIVPFCAAYLLLVAMRGTSTPIFDRYTLPVVALVIPALMAAGRLGRSGYAGAAGAAILVLIAGFYGLITARDAYRQWGARESAAAALTSRGIPRECISGGYEYDGWTERNNAPVFEQDPDRPPRNTPVEYFFLRWTPHVKPKYYLVTSIQSKLPPDPVVDIGYKALLPPGVRHIFVQVDPNASCPAR